MSFFTFFSLVFTFFPFIWMMQSWQSQVLKGTATMIINIKAHWLHVACVCLFNLELNYEVCVWFYILMYSMSSLNSWCLYKYEPIVTLPYSQHLLQNNITPCNPPGLPVYLTLRYKQTHTIDIHKAAPICLYLHLYMVSSQIVHDLHVHVSLALACVVRKSTTSLHLAATCHSLCLSVCQVLCCIPLYSEICSGTDTNVRILWQVPPTSTTNLTHIQKKKQKKKNWPSCLWLETTEPPQLAQPT